MTTENPCDPVAGTPGVPIPKPTLTGFRAFVRHVQEWAEVYVGLPLALLLIPGAAYLIYVLSGRAPAESLGWLVDLAGRVLTITLALVLVSFSTEAAGTWLTKAEKLANPTIYIASTAGKIVLFAMFLYVLTH